MVVRSDNSFEVIWQHRVDEIEQFHLAKVLSFRKGVVFTLDDHTEHPFTIFRITSREDQLKDALAGRSPVELDLSSTSVYFSIPSGTSQLSASRRLLI